jgi:hypothetical protein
MRTGSGPGSVTRAPQSQLEHVVFWRAVEIINHYAEKARFGPKAATEPVKLEHAASIIGSPSRPGHPRISSIMTGRHFLGCAACGPGTYRRHHDNGVVQTLHEFVRLEMCFSGRTRNVAPG